jgi:hypothetical protein
VLFNTFFLFVSSVVYRMSEFNLSISVDKNDCFVILWTRNNRVRFDVIEELTEEELQKTHFNRFSVAFQSLRNVNF